MVVLAHAGHWAVQLLYLAPLIALAVAVMVGKRRERRDQEPQQDETRSDAEGREGERPLDRGARSAAGGGV